MKLNEVPKPYTTKRGRLLSSTYTISYGDTVLFAGLERNDAFRIVGALNGAFFEGVNYAGGIDYGSNHETEGS